VQSLEKQKQKQKKKKKERLIKELNRRLRTRKSGRVRVAAGNHRNLPILGKGNKLGNSQDLESSANTQLASTSLTKAVDCSGCRERNSVIEPTRHVHNLLASQ